MSFISLEFLILVILTLIAYFVIPLKYRWIILLISSVIFYAKGGWFILVMTLSTTAIAYFGAIWIENTDAKDKKRRKTFLCIGIIIVLGLLAFVKLYSFRKWNIPYFVVPVGISYYSFSIVSYLTDVYWKKDKAERNFLKLAVFVLFFPKILQGPISRHRFLGNQLIEGHKFDYKSFTFGIQLIIWGLFKKLVIADRAAIFVGTVYGDLGAYKESGAILVVTMILSAVNLYCDFSGYADIAIGISQMFGIELEQNFNRPFFAKSGAEFWQRWHMTLSGWFKDYLFLPISRSKIVKKFSKKMGERFGPRARKNTMIVISSSVVWLATGVWHGTGLNYIVWGIYWGSIIILSEVFSPEIQKFNKLLHINTEAYTWKVFQMVRTSLIFCVGKMISAQSDLESVGLIIRGIFKSPRIWELFNGDLYKMGLDKTVFQVLLLCILLLWFVSCQQEKGHIRERIANWNAVVRWVFYAVSLLVVLYFGVYGAGYDTSSFAYQFF